VPSLVLLQTSEARSDAAHHVVVVIQPIEYKEAEPPNNRFHKKVFESLIIQSPKPDAVHASEESEYGGKKVVLL
jgi:hypothetical protein